MEKRAEAIRRMRKYMRTREEAIAALIAAGLKATKRDWAMGATIHIASPVGYFVEENGIGAYPIGGYLYPLEHASDNAEWGLMTGEPYAPVAAFDALCLAVRGAIVWFAGEETLWRRRNQPDPMALLKYVQHESRCEALEVMWHKGPCSCGLSKLLKNQPDEIRKHLGPGAIACTTCGDKKTLEQHDGGTIACPNCKE